MIDTIIWDWNGTLLDDTDICIESMNCLLNQRNFPLLSKTRYREIFTFPVRDYYSIAGFNFNVESFDLVAIEFMDLYFARLPHANIFKEAKQVLSSFRQLRFTQILISAMKHESLITSVKEKGLSGYFSHISGIQDHFADGKIENARKIVKDLKLDISKILMIGDTIHDFEVAKELGVECLLVANGHQSIGRLMNLNCPIIEHLNQVVEAITREKSKAFVEN
jgi:phosphoglycolate phosphatase